MTIADLVSRLESIERMAGDEGWGGEFREDLFDLMLQYFKIQFGRPSAGGLLTYLIIRAEKWFSKGELPENRNKENANE